MPPPAAAAAAAALTDETEYATDETKHATDTSPGMSLFSSDNLSLPSWNSGASAGGRGGRSGRSKAAAGAAEGAGSSFAAVPEEFLAEYLALTLDTAISNSSNSNSSSKGAAQADDGKTGLVDLSTASGSSSCSADFESDLRTLCGGSSGGELSDLSAEELSALTMLDAISNSTTDSANPGAPQSHTQVLLPAARVSDIILSLDAALLQSNLVLSHIVRKLGLQHGSQGPYSLERFAEAHFQYDRRSGSSGSGGRLQQHPTERLLCFQAGPLKASLTPLPPAPASLHSEALAIFRLILAFISGGSAGGGGAGGGGGGGKGSSGVGGASVAGAAEVADRHDVPGTPSSKSAASATIWASSSAGDSSTSSTSSIVSGDAQLELIDELLLKVMNGPAELQDEALCQLCKQTRRNPSAESCALAWQLLLVVLCSVPPSRRLLPHLISYCASSLHAAQLSSSNSSSASEAAAGTGPDSINSADLGASTSTSTSAGVTATTAASASTSATSVLPASSASSAAAAAVARVVSGEAGTIEKLAYLSLRACAASAACAPRSELPSPQEVRALLLGEPLPVCVCTLDGAQLLFAVDSFSSVKQLSQQVCERLHVAPDQRHLFALYECSGSPSTPWSLPHTSGHAHGQALGQGSDIDHGAGAGAGFDAEALVPVAAEERVLDWVARCLRVSTLLGLTGVPVRGQAQGQGQGLGGTNTATSVASLDSQQQLLQDSTVDTAATVTGASTASIFAPRYQQQQQFPYPQRLVLRARFVFRLCDHLHDPVTARLLFGQAVCDVIGARYPHCAADALLLAALQMQERFGDFVAGSRSLQDICKHAHAASSSSTTTTASTAHERVRSSRPPGSLTLASFVAGSFLSTGHTAGGTWVEQEQRVLQLYRALQGIPPADARRLYLLQVDTWKLFGATFFNVAAQLNSNSPDLCSAVVLAISAKGVVLVDPQAQTQAPNGVGTLGGGVGGDGGAFPFIAQYGYGEIFSWGHSFDSFVLVTGSKAAHVKAYFKAERAAQAAEMDALVHVYHQAFRRQQQQQSGGSSGGSSGGGGGTRSRTNSSSSIAGGDLTPNSPTSSPAAAAGPSNEVDAFATQ